MHALADKGLGPVAIELERYITDALKHLLDKDTYEVIPEEQALQDAEKLSSEIFEWTRKWRGNLTDMSVKYIRKKLTDSIIDPFGYFYLLYKLHKTPIKTRPVCSDCASLPHALGEWVDEMLQPLVKAQATYFKDSFALKKWLNSLTLPANSSLFTYDAVSMYTNIDTEDCIAALSDFLLSRIQTAKFTHYSPRALIEAIKIVMRNNRMRFGDIIVKQLRGIAMGMSPAPSIANLYVAIHELKSILQHVGSFIFFLRRFIDDGFGVWLHDADPLVDAANWKLFKNTVNNGGLNWTFTDRSRQVDFMDMTIKIVGSKIETTLFEKPLALHLYIPPHSCHPPGVIIGIVMGNVLRIFQLCSRQMTLITTCANSLLVCLTEVINLKR